VFDNPHLVVACVVGDGEAETGPLATAWHSNKFLNPVSDGAVPACLSWEHMDILPCGNSWWAPRPRPY
jgi:phosphoketolase